ncbi:MAG: extracellular solute-binding protein [Treponema sp.]|jgi:phosphate transport system substrate-binding protein|nr:extracellular solute-binding protein [Treponema sp.]
MKKNLKTIIKGFAGLALCSTMLLSCGTKNSTEITVISRESGSGTRGAFVELFEIEKKNAEGKKIDYTINSADISNSTEVVIQSVAGNVNAIGYISLGSLNNSVKALKIDNATASVQSIKDNSYKISRPFNIVVKNDNKDEKVQDFINFILSKDGQAVVENKGYISVTNNSSYVSKELSGKITVAGSSSVFPVMEKLAEAYQKVNSGMTVEVSQSDSGTGITSATQGVCDIGMSSRDLKDSEIEKGIKPIKIAIDGVAVIVNKNNQLSNITKEEVCSIYTGTITNWNQVK